MNILIPNSWLAEFLKTDATPAEIKEYLSLCGPSIERMNHVGKETVYDIEITTNRVDSYSVMGVAREAATILPRFGKKAELIKTPPPSIKFPKTSLGIHIEDKHGFCRRVVAVKISNITLAPSPAWLTAKLELVGQRPINNIVDITNYIMWETGHPMHAFDYDRLAEKKIIVREAKKGEKVISLDKKVHIMLGGELVFDDGTGTIIDIPGIMGTANTVVTPQTKNVLLFIENSDPSKIRFTSMAHSIRTQAAVINEKDPDPELAMIAMLKGITLACQLTKGTVGSEVVDIYPKKFTPYSVSLSRTKLNSYIGTSLSDKEITHILTTLGFETQMNATTITVNVPSSRRDVTLDVDIIEEVARIYGYHNIEATLPDTAPPVTIPDTELVHEEQIKIRLRDWGYTEIYTNSMISSEQMKIFKLDTSKAYKILNPLSSDWEYMRPALWPSILDTISKNINAHESLKLFELSMNYRYQKGELPKEVPVLVVAWTGKAFQEAKGLAQVIFSYFGIPFVQKSETSLSVDWYSDIHFGFGNYGTMGEVKKELLVAHHISKPVTILDLEFTELVKNAKPTYHYTPIPKYPPAVEDFSFIVPAGFAVGPFMEKLQSVHPLVHDVSLLDSHQNSRTIHVTYLDPKRNLTGDDVKPVREKLIAYAEKQFSAKLKS